MRTARIKVSPLEGASIYHCMTKTVNGEWLFGEEDQEMFRQMLWLVADGTGIEVLTYAILSNHPHILVRVPQLAPVTDEELLRRYAVRRPQPTQYETAQLEVIRAQLSINGPEAVAWRRRQLALMGDVSQFMKLLKQRFSRWFNRRHHRIGTLWAERFKSVLIEDEAELKLIMALYVDLNPVRAHLVDDPKDYRFCGYGEAIGGSVAAQRGIIAITETTSWSEAQAAYRLALFAVGSGPREHGRIIPAAAFERVIREGGRLPLATVLRHRIRYFNDGAVLGTKAFVATQLATYRAKLGRRLHSTPRLLPSITEWGELAALRGLRQRVFG